MSNPSERALVYATALHYAKARIRRDWSEGSVLPCPTGLTLHNLARSRVTRSLLALARINLARQSREVAQ